MKLPMFKFFIFRTLHSKDSVVCDKHLKGYWLPLMLSNPYGLSSSLPYHSFYERCQVSLVFYLRSFITLQRYVFFLNKQNKIMIIAFIFVMRSKYTLFLPYHKPILKYSWVAPFSGSHRVWHQY